MWNRARLRGLPIVAVLVAAIVYSGWRRTPTPQAGGAGVFGKVLRGRGPTTRSTLRVGTFNIRAGVGRDGRFDLSRTAAAIGQCDLVGLNEVAGRDDQNNQARILGEKLGLGWLWAPSERRWWHDHWGNGMLSSLPVKQWERWPLNKTRPQGYRSLLISRQEFAGRVLNVIIVHTDGSEDRDVQVRAVVGLFGAMAPPAILMGDLNTPATHPQLVWLREFPGVVDALGEVVGKPAARIDWIWVKGLKVLSSGVVDNGASDHPFYWAELTAEE